MKKINKNSAIIISVIISVILIIGIIFSFVPMSFGSKTFLSFSGSLNVSSDMMGGMYGEYEITTENATKSELVSSMAKVKNVFEELGYKNVNVYTIGNSRMRVEVSYPRGSKTFAYEYSELSLVSGGTFFLSDKYSADEDTVEVRGSECVDKVKVYTNNSVKYISIIFNEKGQELFKELCNTTTSIYLHLGDYAQQISASNVTDFTSFTLSDTDYANLISLEQRVVIGCMGIEINSDTAIIETMSSSLVPGASSPEERGFSMTTVSIIAIAALAVVFVGLIAFFALKFGAFAILVAISMLFNAVLFLILMNLMPSIEIGLAGIVSLALGTALIYLYTYVFASKVKSEYDLGKSFSAALESAYKKTLPTILISNIALFISSLIMFAFSFGELTSATVIFAICMGLSLFTNLLLIPLFVKLGISMTKAGSKLFKLPKREIGFEQVTDEEKGEA